MPRTNEENLRIKEKRREDIINTSLKLFSKYGYDEISINDIARACSCSHGLLYHYFKSKDEIIDILKDRTKELFQNKFLEYTQLYEPGPQFLKKMHELFFSYIKGDEIHNYYLHLFLMTKFYYLDKGVIDPSESLKIRDYVKDSLEIVRKSCKELNEKDFHDLIKFYMFSLNAISMSKILFPNTFKDPADPLLALRKFVVSEAERIKENKQC